MRVSIIIFLLSISAFANPMSGFLVSADSAFMHEDHFQAARLYSVVLQQSPKSLAANQVENYIVSQSLLLTKKGFLELCSEASQISEKSNEIRFYCGKYLIQDGNPSDGLNFLDAVPPAYHKLEYHLVKATGYLYSGRSSQCVVEIEKTKKKITQRTSEHFKNLLDITSARCLSDQQKYELAQRKLRELNVGNSLYLSILEEQAWVQFSLRNLNSSREILKIILDKIKSASLSSQESVYSYFRAKYMMGYIDLATNNSEKAKLHFDQIVQEIFKYKEEQLQGMRIAPGLAKYVSRFSKRIDLGKNPKYQKFRTLAQAWAEPHIGGELDKSIRLSLAMNLELERSNLPQGYKNRIQSLKNANTRYMAEIFKEQFNSIKRRMDSIQFKSSMGQLENVWVQRTEGKRTIAEAIEAYNKEIGGVEEYLGK